MSTAPAPPTATETIVGPRSRPWRHARRRPAPGAPRRSWAGVAGPAVAWCLRLGVLLLLASPAAAATYNYTSPLFTVVVDHTTCVVGTCSPYTTAMQVTGSFTTAAPLPPSVSNHNVARAVSAFTFADGVNTIASSDVDARLSSLAVSTDATGAVTSVSLRVQRWITGGPGHAAGDGFDAIAINGDTVSVDDNLECATVSTSPTSGAADACSAFVIDSNTSRANAFTPPSWLSPAPQPPHSHVFTGSTYTSLDPNTTCTVGPCSNFTTAMRVAGSFDTHGPLEPNLVLANLAPLATSFAFQDGLHVYVSGDPNVRIGALRVSTDGTGQITGWVVAFLRWRSAGAAHAIGDRYDFFQSLDGLVTSADDNGFCELVATDSSGVADNCTSTEDDTNTSSALTTVDGGWTSLEGQAGAPAGIPTLSEWALIALAGALAAAGGLLLRRAGG
jgi:hypothetical protein